MQIKLFALHMTALVMNVNIVQWMNGNQKNKTKKLQNAFLRPSFPGQIRREEIILEFRFYDSL